MTKVRYVVRAHLKHTATWLMHWRDARTYAIADSGADATVVGRNAKILSTSGCSARILVFDLSQATSKNKIKCNLPVIMCLAHCHAQPTHNMP